MAILFLLLLFYLLWLHWVFIAAWAFSSCREWGLLIVVASLVVEYGF